MILCADLTTSSVIKPPTRLFNISNMIDSCGNAHCHVLMFAHNFDRNLVAENKRVYYAGFIRVTGPVRKMRYDAGRYGTGLALSAHVR